MEQRTRTIQPSAKKAEETKVPDEGWFKSGNAVTSTAAREAAERDRKKAMGFMPFRFRMKVDSPKEIIILDYSSDEVIGLYEHTVRDGRGGWATELCPQEFETCPLCEDKEVGKSAYVIFLTCLLLEEWTDKQGVVHPYSKLLLPLKGTVQQEMLDYHTLKGGWRGQHIEMRRYSDKEAATGRPFNLIAKYTDEELIENFGHPEMVNEKGEVYKEANEDVLPFNYAKLFNKKPSAADLRKRYGYAAAAGSSDEYKGSFNSTSANKPAEGGRATRSIRSRNVEAVQPTTTAEELDDEVPFDK